MHACVLMKHSPHDPLVPSLPTKPFVLSGRPQSELVRTQSVPGTLQTSTGCGCRNGIAGDCWGAAASDAGAGGGARPEACMERRALTLSLARAVLLVTIRPQQPHAPQPQRCERPPMLDVVVYVIAACVYVSLQQVVVCHRQNDIGSPCLRLLSRECYKLSSSERMIFYQA